MKIIKITANWCPECLIMRPRWKEIMAEMPTLEVEDIDYDKNPDLRLKYNVKKSSTVIFFDKNGQELWRFIGLLEKDELMKKILELKNF